MEINFYWHGAAMSDVHRACIRSWADRGFKPQLWSYTNVKLDCAKSRNAREIMPLEPREHPALFSDGFRYKLLSERGGYWMDTDIVCNTDELSFAETTFASEDSRDGNFWQTNCFIYAVPGCEVLKRTYEAYLEVPRPLGWGMTGPVLVSRILRDCPANILSPKAFCPLPWWDYKKVGSKSFFIDLSDSMGLHLWHELWRRDGGFKGVHKYSFLSQLMKNR